MSEVNPDISKEYKNIPVRFNNESALERQGLIIMEPEEVTVNVKVVGKKSDMANFSQESIKAQVDLSGYKEGQIKVPINVNLNQSNNIKIVGHEPREALFTFDKLITKEKNLRIKTKGTLGANYVVGDMTTKSKSVLLKGPRTLVNKVSEAIVEVDLNNRKEDESITVPIKLIDDEGHDVIGVEKEPKVVDITIPIFRTVNVPIELNLQEQLPDNYEITEITINPNKITLKGDKSISNLTFIQTKPIDVNKLIGNTDVPVELELPENVSLLNPNEKITVSLNIEENSTKVFEYELNEVEIRNLDNSLAIDTDDSSRTIQVSVKGSKKIVEALTKEDIELYLDFNMIDEGTHKVYLGSNIPTGITIKEIIPQSIEFKIIKR
nr:CdaR family protein [Tissierella praeacuta]